jgi:hypothetical protein
MPTAQKAIIVLLWNVYGAVRIAITVLGKDLIAARRPANVKSVWALFIVSWVMIVLIMYV